jgi:hypothetical protein
MNILTTSKKKSNRKDGFGVRIQTLAIKPLPSEENKKSPGQ